MLPGSNNTRGRAQLQLSRSQGDMQRPLGHVYKCHVRPWPVSAPAFHNPPPGQLPPLAAVHPGM